MNELLPNDPEYKRVFESYKELLEKSILRSKNLEFIGGLPITLMQRHLFNLVVKSDKYSQFSKYTGTAKVDGTRLLMYINEKDPNDPEFRKIHFIDRSLKIYTLSNKQKLTLNSIKSPKMILDGELVFYKNNKSNYYLPSSETDYLSFMVFDILYGPISIKLEDPLDISPVYGSANTMIGPIGGEKWDYAKRYNLLKNLIISTKNNNDNPPLAMHFAFSNFCRIELKSLVFINKLKQVDNVDKYIEDDFIKFRNKYYDFLSSKLPSSKSINEKIKLSTLDFDGIIFTPIDTSYVIGNWNLFMNTQYKWKPPKEQTIDFLVENTEETFRQKGQTKSYKVVKLYVLSRGELQLFDFNGINTGLVESKFIVNNGSIAEFGYDPKLNNFVFNRLRLDKDRPNAWRTAQTVKESITKPVDLNNLKIILNLNEKEIFKIAQSYLLKDQLNRFLLCMNKLKIINDFSLNQINILQQEKKLNKDLELEIRLGKIKSKFFNAGVSETIYKNSIKLFNKINWKYSVNNYVDCSIDSLRTRYKFIPQLQQLVKISSIQKEPQVKIDIPLKDVASFDLRVASSTETETKEIVNFANATRITTKDRISYYDPEGIIQVDLTQVSLAELQNGAIVKKKTPTFQIEFEVLGGNLSNLLNFINFYISEIETIWD